MHVIFTAFVLLFGSVGLALAAEVEPSTTEGCDYHLRGTIAAGDTDKLDIIPGSFDGLVLCLDSPGGSLTEGASMFHHIWWDNIITRVLAGERCLSACALAFLGGSVDSGSALIKSQERVLDPGGIIGFHAPSMILPERNNYPAKDVMRSFEIALKTAEDLFAIKLTEHHGVSAMNDYLYDRILQTRPENMYYIETIGDAVLANIAPSDWTAPPVFGEAEVTHICDNAWVANFATIGQDGSSASEYYQRIASGDYDEKKTIIVQKADHSVGKVYDYYARAKFGSLGCYVVLSESDRVSYDLEVYFVHYMANHDFDVSPDNNDNFVEKALRVPPWYALNPDQLLAQRPKLATVQDTQPTSDFNRFVGYDLFGGDLSDGLIRQLSDVECKSACAARSSCDAASYDRWNRVCFLKSVLSSSRRLSLVSKADTFIRRDRLELVNQSRTDAVKIIAKNGKAFRDPPFQSRFATNLEECSSRCNGNECLAFNWHEQRKLCELFDHPGEYFDADDAVAGYFQQEALD